MPRVVVLQDGMLLANEMVRPAVRHRVRCMSMDLPLQGGLYEKTHIVDHA